MTNAHRTHLNAVAIAVALAIAPVTSAQGPSAPAATDVPVKGAFDDYDKHGPDKPRSPAEVARGEEVVSSTGVPMKRSRPLDFLVVADHAEGLGSVTQLAEGNSALTGDPTLARWDKALKAGGEEAKTAKNELVSAQAQGKLPPVGDTVDVARATWTNSIGAPELVAVWKDPSFDPSQRAFYYGQADPGARIS